MIPYEELPEDGKDIADQIIDNYILYFKKIRKDRYAFNLLCCVRREVMLFFSMTSIIDLKKNGIEVPLTRESADDVVRSLCGHSPDLFQTDESEYSAIEERFANKCVFAGMTKFKKT